MVHRLVLLRHGEASVDAGTDHARQLTAAGGREVSDVATRLRELGWIPDRVVTSSANRARSSAALVTDALETPAAIVHGELYNGGLAALRAAISSLDEDVASVLVVGHNPGLSAAASRLTSSSVALSTANAALMQIESDSWEEAIDADGGWTLDRVVMPA
jgi:phosphohistidine phosphatase